MIVPRDYQQYAIAQAIEYISTKEGNPVIAMPTGTGKSIVIGGIIWWIMSRWPTQRCMMVTHSRKLIEQNAEKLLDMWPTAPLGLYSAGLKKKQFTNPVIFGGIQSMGRVGPIFGHVDILLIDEAHTVSPDETTLYQKLIADLLAINPHLKVIGLSATPFRLGLGMITDGGIFTDLAVDMCSLEAFNWFIEEGYLSPLVPRPTNTKLDTSGVKKRGGEFIEKDLQRAVDKAEITDAALREALEHVTGRKRILVFTTGVEHAEHVAEALQVLGESALCVHSKMGDVQVDNAFAAHQSGQVRWLVGNNMFTTGYDDPEVDCIIMLRPTNSPGLWVQMLGRGTRPLYAPGFDLSTAQGRLAAIAASEKQNCLVLDFAANTSVMGPINDPMIPKPKGKGGGEPPVKFCEKQKVKQGSPAWDKLTKAQVDEFLSRYEKDPLGSYVVTGCSAFNHTSARNCVQCGAEFLFKPNITAHASEQELIAKQRKKDKPPPGDEPHGEMPQVEDFTVDRVVYAVHEKAGGSASMKVTYHCGLRAFSEWVPAWHETNVRFRGRKWWEERTDIPLPDTPQDAVDLCEELAVPRTVRVWINKKYPEIIGHGF